MEDEPYRAFLHPPGLFRGLDGQLPGAAMGQGGAEALCRTPLAQRRAVGQADSGPQLHQRLVKGPRGVNGDDCLQPLRHLFLHLGGGDVSVVPCDPGVYPQDVAVHGGDGLAEGNGADGPGGIVPHPRQGPDGPVV